MNKITIDSLIDKIYDYIVNKCEKEGKLLPISELWHEGFGKVGSPNYKIFEATYNGIKKYLNS